VMTSIRERVLENPFYVLGIAPNATREDAERQGRKLLGQLELRVASVGRYWTPLGEQERSAERVRDALAKFRDPDKRLMSALWAEVQIDHATPETQAEPESFNPFRSAGFTP
jgi:hypothetical protein